MRRRSPALYRSSDRLSYSSYCMFHNIDIAWTHLLSQHFSCNRLARCSRTDLYDQIYGAAVQCDWPTDQRETLFKSEKGLRYRLNFCNVECVVGHTHRGDRRWMSTQVRELIASTAAPRLVVYVGTIPKRRRPGAID